MSVAETTVGKRRKRSSIVRIPDDFMSVAALRLVYGEFSDESMRDGIRQAWKGWRAAVQAWRRDRPDLRWDFKQERSCLPPGVIFSSKRSAVSCCNVWCPFCYVQRLKKLFYEHMWILMVKHVNILTWTLEYPLFERDELQRRYGARSFLLDAKKQLVAVARAAGLQRAVVFSRFIPIAAESSLSIAFQV